MFEKGNLLLFRPFVFKNGAMPKDKFFLVLENVDGNLFVGKPPHFKGSRAIRCGSKAWLLGLG